MKIKYSCNECFAVLALLVLAIRPTSGHRQATTKPSCGADYGSSGDALRILDPSMSWAFNHYLGCMNRGVWVTLENPVEDFPFYMGALVPKVPRFSSVRPTALVTGPGLPVFTNEEWDKVPTEIKNDSVWNGPPRGILLESPENQSTCDHVGTTMAGLSNVQDGRCSYLESDGQSYAWPVLDAQDITLPVEGAVYHVVIWVQSHTSSKLTVALGSWVEDFVTPYELDEPSCPIRLNDFHEKYTQQAAKTPFRECEVDSNPLSGESVNEEPEVCVKGVICASDDENCIVAGIPYQTPSMVCGGRQCPVATALWDEVNMRMMVDMMDMEYTGNPDIDFVRGMIPHHEAAVEMCRILIEDLTCTEVSDIDNLDGLLDFCNHVQMEQELEVGGMRLWLAEKGIDEKAPCPMMTMARQGGHDHGSAVMESCGDVSAPSSAALIQVNNQMHSGMAIDVSCEHSIDFVRGMIPHHEAAVGMCDVLLHSSTDPYLTDLCHNITYTQYAEITWMHKWLDQRGHDSLASCEACTGTGANMDHHGSSSHSNTIGMGMGMGEMHSNTTVEGDAAMEFNTMGGENVTDMTIMMGSNMTDFNETMDLEDETMPLQDSMPVQMDPPVVTAPCEDMLPTSSFCHLSGQHAYCRCSDVVGQLGECGSTIFLQGFGLMVVDEQCARSCGLCPARMTLFHYLCDDQNMSDHSNSGGDNMSHEGMDEKDDGSTRDDSSGCRLKQKSILFGVVMVVIGVGTLEELLF